MHDEQEPSGWSLPKRWLLRFALVYFLLYTQPFPLNLLPHAAGWTDWLQEGVAAWTRWWTSAERAAVDLVAERVLGIEETLDRPYGSGDPTYSYVLLALELAAAALVASLWSALQRRPLAHRALAAWLQVGARFYLAFTLLGYGFAKVHPSQFPAPGLGRLVTPFGDGSPMNLLWSFMGSSPGYVVFSGVCEVLAGLLLCFRRTSTLGALLTVAVMTNVAAVNYFYDVPVKLFSTHLLAFALALCLPDLRRLVDLLLFNRPAPARDLSRPRLGYAGHLARLLVVGFALWSSIVEVHGRWTAPAEVAPLHGVWDVARYVEDGAELPPLVTDRRRWSALVVEHRGFGWIQAMDGSLRMVSLAHDEAAATLALSTSATWRYRLEGDALALQGEFARWFQADPGAGASPGEPRDPQVELVLQRDVSEATVAPDDAASLYGRWTLAGEELVGEVATRRRSEPTGWTAVTLGIGGTAEFELQHGGRATYALGIDDGAGLLTFRSSGTLALSSPDPQALTLTGELRGHTLEIDLRRRDPASFLLVRRGYHWINEIPLNRF